MLGLISGLLLVLDHSSHDDGWIIQLNFLRTSSPPWGTYSRSSRPVLRRMTFFACVQIKLALSQASWLCIFWRKISSVAPPWGTWLRTLYRWDRKEKKPSTWWDSNPRPLCLDACALPLCHIHCLKKDKVSLSDSGVKPRIFIIMRRVLYPLLQLLALWQM